MTFKYYILVAIHRVKIALFHWRLRKGKGTQSCPTLQLHGLYNPWNSAGQNTGVGNHSPRRFSQPRDQTQVSCITGGFFTIWATREVWRFQFSSVAQSYPDSLWPNELQHARPPCPSSTSRVYSNSCPLSCWCHPVISSSVVPFSSCPQSFPVSGSFQMSQLSASGGQSLGVSASTSVLPMNIQGWSPLGWTSWISLQSKGLSRVFSNTTVQKHQFLDAQLSSKSNSHIHTWPLEKP